ncbi:hypothetical protein [Okeania sp. SIO2G5]|nr:hypothetical protein [Okeania sp. SIO2G5]NEP76698.1 hypothetical protein [Okeania sp. SIO2G5]
MASQRPGVLRFGPFILSRGRRKTRQNTAQHNVIVCWSWINRSGFIAS